MNKRRVFLIGPRSGLNVKGGVTYLHDDLRSELLLKGYSLSEVNSNFKELGIWKLIKNIFRSATMLHASDVVIFNCTFRQLVVFGPLLAMFCTRSQKLIIRKWAGSFFKDYDRSSFVVQKLIQYTLMRSNLNCFETQHIVALAEKRFGKTYWFPNVRHDSPHESPLVLLAPLKAIFVGRIIQEKGVLIACDAVSKLVDVELTIFGRIEGEISAEFLNSYKNVTYGGELASTEIQEEMSKYNLLILPTFFHGEGYPGVIIEAFSVSVPVITTSHNYLPELVGDAGYLIPTHSSTSLEQRISCVKSNYETLRRNARTRFSSFDSKRVHHDFFQKLDELMEALD